MAKARVETALCGLLLVNPEVRALIATDNTPPRIYWGMAPANVANSADRYVVFRRLTDQPDNTGSGHSGMTIAQYAFACWSKISLDDATNLADAIEEVFDDACASGTFVASGVTIQGLRSDGQTDDLESPWEGGETGLSARVVRCTVAYETAG